jgi:RND family efflux transporter MFP subunit
VVLTGVVAAAGGAGYFAVDRFQDDGNGAATELQPIAVRVGDVSDAVSTNGSLVFPNRDTAGFGTPGTVGEVLVAEGDSVTEGQVVATLDAATVTGLEETVARAEVTLREAEEKLADLNAPVDDLILARTEVDVAAAAAALAKAEDALAVFTGGDALARAEVGVVSAQTALIRAEEALATFTGGEPLARANEDLEAAQITLANVTEAYRISEREWAEKTIEAETDVADARTAYSDAVMKWFGVTLSGLESSLSPGELLEGWGATYDSIYGRDVDGEFGPSPDIPATPWDELTVTLWTQTFPFGVDATCDSSPDPGDPSCVQDEMETAWTAIADASNASEKVASNAANALETSATAVTREADNVAAAESAVSDATDPLTLASLEGDVALKLLALSDAESAVRDATDPLSLVSLESDIALKRAALSDAESDLLDLQTNAPDVEGITLARTQIAVAEVALADAKVALSGAVMTAPFSGEVVEVLVEAGDRLNVAGAPVVDLVDRSVIEVDAVVDEIDVLSVFLGASANVTMDALGGRVLPGTVSEIGTAANSQQGVVTFPVRVRIEVPDDLALREGLSATASVVSAEETNAILVPNSAIGGSFIAPTVERLRDGMTQTVAVEIGLSDGFWVAVRSGLEQGDQVLVEPATGSTGDGATPDFFARGGAGTFPGPGGTGRTFVIPDGGGDFSGFGGNGGGAGRRGQFAP